jgi:hypothetical protein
MPKTNDVKCGECGFGIPVDANERVILCDNPALKSYGKKVKHGMRFSCGYGATDGMVTIHKPASQGPTTAFVPKIPAPPEVPHIATLQEPIRVRVIN